MKVLTLLAQKGGAGKSTLALHWAVEAERSGKRRVVIIDMDPQASAASWYEKRNGDTPVLVQVEEGGLPDAIEACRTDGVDWVLMDTPPHMEARSVAAARVADLVVIPTRPTVLDLEAIGASVEVVEAVKKPAALILNACPPRSAVTDDARAALQAYGLPICPTAIVQRVALQYALTDGRAACELEPRGKAAAEIAATWHWITRQSRKV